MDVSFKKFCMYLSGAKAEVALFQPHVRIYYVLEIVRKANQEMHEHNASCYYADKIHLTHKLQTDS